MARVPPKTAEPDWESSSWFEHTEASMHFKADPTLENYLRLRDESEQVGIDVRYWDSLGLFFQHQEKLKTYGFLDEAVEVFFERRREKIPALCLAIARAILSREEASDKSAYEDGILEQSTVDWLINAMLDLLTTEPALPVPPELHVLIKHSMKAEMPKALRAVYSESRDMFIVEAKARSIAVGHELTDEELGHRFGVNKATVSRTLKRKAKVLEHFTNRFSLEAAAGADP